MKNILVKVALSTFLIGSALVASPSEYEVDTYSLVGIEGGYSSFDYERVELNQVTLRPTTNLGHVGIKVGAQSDSYRIFLSARIYDAGDFDYVRTYGVEGQYMFNFSKYANFFIGINAGTADIRYIDKVYGNNTTVNMYAPYLGADLGVNIHIGKSVDFEMGTRIMGLNADKIGYNSATNQFVTYKFDNLISAYGSIIFKFKMD